MQSSEPQSRRIELATPAFASGLGSSIDLRQGNSYDADDYDDSHQHRRIIICCDGTWNDRETNQPLTNVTRIQSCLAVRDKRHKDRYEQLSYYIDGIGAGTTLGGVIHDGSTGSGIERKIREAYRHLCLTYTDGDEIILIGFSRGAFTVRCLASLINDVGLLDGIWVNKELPAIFELWKNQDNSDQHDHQNDEDDQKLSPLEKHCRELIEKYREQKGTILRREVRIKACAVWDTVKSLGFPWPKRIPHKKSRQYSFVNYRLTPNIDNAFQALSLDERRWHFPPVVWSKSQQGQALKQCWFLGSHSDIGGGYHNTGFANITLCWMISQLQPFVQFDEKAIWHSTEDGKILGVNVAKENKELLTRSRGRPMAKANKMSLFPRSKSGPPDGEERSNSRESFLSWSRNTRSHRSTKVPSPTRSDVPPINVIEAASGQDSTAQEREAENMDESNLLVPSDFDVTSDEASMNPEDEPDNTQGISDERALNSSKADGSGQLPLTISDMHRHTWQGVWALGGSKTREVGVYRTAGDDSRSPLGGPSPDTSNDDLGSNESIHFSVRVLSEIHPLQRRKRCRALQNFDILENAKGDVIWHDKNARWDVPQDNATEYEQAMLHRWLDRDFAARETLGGQNASEAIAGSTLSPARAVAQAGPSVSRSSQSLLQSPYSSAALSPRPSEVPMSTMPPPMSTMPPPMSTLLPPMSMMSPPQSTMPPLHT